MHPVKNGGITDLPRKIRIDCRILNHLGCPVAFGQNICSGSAQPSGMHAFGDLVGKVMVGIAVVGLICTYEDHHIA